MRAVMGMADDQVLREFSTSPDVEPPEFVADLKSALAWVSDGWPLCVGAVGLV